MRACGERVKACGACARESLRRLQCGVCTRCNGRAPDAPSSPPLHPAFIFFWAIIYAAVTASPGGGSLRSSVATSLPRPPRLPRGALAPALVVFKPEGGLLELVALRSAVAWAVDAGARVIIVANDTAQFAMLASARVAVVSTGAREALVEALQKGPRPPAE